MPSIVMLVTASEATNILYHGVSAEFPVTAVIVEDRIDRLRFIRRRLHRLGAIVVAGQILFQTLATPILRASSKTRRAEIVAARSLDPRPIPTVLVRRVTSVNSEETIALLRELAPLVVLVSGTRILSRKLLEAMPSQFINVHAGITPRYRGVHGAYWSLVMRDVERCGVTVQTDRRGYRNRLGDRTGDHPAHEPRHHSTYPLLQIAEAPPLVRAMCGLD